MINDEKEDSFVLPQVLVKNEEISDRVFRGSFKTQARLD